MSQSKVFNDVTFQFAKHVHGQIFEDVLASPNFSYYPDDIFILACNQIKLRHLPFAPDPSKKLSENLQIITNLLADRQIYGAAFALTVLILCCKELDTHKEENLKKAIALRKKVQGDIAKYKEELKSFEDVISSKMVFQMLDMILDEVLFTTIETRDKVELAEQYWMLVRKHLVLNITRSDGSNASSIPLGLSMLLFLAIYRVKQGRYILSVFAHLTKNAGKKDKELFKEHKKLYLSHILQTSDYLQNYKMTPLQAKYFEFDDKVIPCDINVPDGEDMELPVRPLVTDAEFNAVKTKVRELYGNNSFLDARDFFLKFS